MRGSWGKKCLESMGGRRIIDRVGTIDGLKGGKEVERWIAGIIVVANVSTNQFEDYSSTDTLTRRNTISSIGCL